MSTVLKRTDVPTELISTALEDDCKLADSAVVTLDCNKNDNIKNTMTFCKLVGEIWKNYFNLNNCKLMEETGDKWPNILQYIIIIVDCPVIIY